MTLTLDQSRRPEKIKGVLLTIMQSLVQLHGIVSEVASGRILLPRAALEQISGNVRC